MHWLLSWRSATVGEAILALRCRLFRGDAKLEAAAQLDSAHILPGSRGPHVGKIQQAIINLDGAKLARDPAQQDRFSALAAALRRDAEAAAPNPSAAPLAPAPKS